MNTIIRFYTAFFPIFLSVAVLAQPAEEWSSSYGGEGFEEGQALASIPEGGFVMVGASSSNVSGTLVNSSFGSNDYLVVRVNADSTIAWERRVGGTDNDVATEVLVDSRGQIIVAGRSRSRINGSKTTEVFGFQEIWVVAFDLNGTELWQQSFGGTGGEEPFGIVEADSGNLFIAARTDSPPHASTPQRVAPLKGNNSYWLVELTSTGDFVREHIYGGDGQDLLWGMYKLLDASIILYGASQSGVSLDKTSPGFGSSDMWLIRVDQQGRLLNQYTFGGDQPENPLFVTQYRNGDIFVSGQSRSSTSGNKASVAFGALDLWCIRFDQTTGNIVWENTYGGSEDDNAFTGAKNINDYIVLAGNTRSADRGVGPDVIEGLDDAWMKYISPDGDQIWDITQNGNRRENIRGLTRSNSGGWYLVGESNSDAFDWKNGPSYGTDFNGVRSNDIWYAKLQCDFFVELGVRDTSICEGESLTLRNKTIGTVLPHTSFLWSDGSSDSLLALTPITDVEVILESVSPDACEARDTVFIAVNANPMVEELVLTNESCAGTNDASIFFEASVNATNFVFDNITYTAPTLFEDMTAGDYNFRVNSTLERCGFDTTVTLLSENDFSVDLGNDVELIIGEFVTLDANPSTSDSLTYRWTGLPGLCNNCEVQSVRMMQKSATVTVTATNEQGCSKTSSILIEGLEDKRIGIPNAFSPNNDGTNDRFAVFPSPFVEKMGPMRIFNRWGNLVYVGIGEQLTRAEGWDGNVNGKPVQSGVYTYILPVVFIDGDERIFQGEINILH